MNRSAGTGALVIPMAQVAEDAQVAQEPAPGGAGSDWRSHSSVPTAVSVQGAQQWRRVLVRVSGDRLASTQTYAQSKIRWSRSRQEDVSAVIGRRWTRRPAPRCADTSTCTTSVRQQQRGNRGRQPRHIDMPGVSRKHDCAHVDPARLHLRTVAARPCPNQQPLAAPQRTRLHASRRLVEGKRALPALHASAPRKEG